MAHYGRTTWWNISPKRRKKKPQNKMFVRLRVSQAQGVVKTLLSRSLRLR